MLSSGLYSLSCWPLGSLLYSDLVASRFLHGVDRLAWPVSLSLLVPLSTSYRPRLPLCMSADSILEPLLALCGQLTDY